MDEFVVYFWYLAGPYGGPKLNRFRMTTAGVRLNGETLRTSDCGYGYLGVALCDGLVEAGAQRSAGDHDLTLTWVRG